VVKEPASASEATTATSRGDMTRSRSCPQFVKAMTAAEALNMHRSKLTMFEMAEISQYDAIYTIGGFRAKQSMTQKDGTYKAHVGEQLKYRYEVRSGAGKGAFGQVLKCADMKENGRMVAIKISKAEQSETENAQIEAKFLTKIANRNPDRYSLVKAYDRFFFRHHFFIVTELLDINLY